LVMTAALINEEGRKRGITSAFSQVPVFLIIPPRGILSFGIANRK
jgi:hypothetical protein